MHAYIYTYTYVLSCYVFWQIWFRPWNHCFLSGLQRDLDNWQLYSRPERTHRAGDYRCLLAVALISVGLYFNALPRSTKRETVFLCRFPVEKLHQYEGEKRHQLPFHLELMWSAVSEEGRGGLFQFQWNQDFQSFWAANSSPSFLLFRLSSNPMSASKLHCWHGQTSLKQGEDWAALLHRAAACLWWSWQSSSCW